MKHTFSVLLLLFLAGGIFLFTSCKKKEVEYTPVEPDPRVNLQDDELPYYNEFWMQYIDDDKYLDQITFPGTHDCAADKHTSDQGAAWRNVICQDYYISNQMNLGVRWFDVRLHLDQSNGVLTAYHWHYYLHKNFNDLLTAALDFVQAHPTETVIYMIKQEYSTVHDDDFANAVAAYLYDRSPDLSAFYVSEEMPQLCEVRGKVVIMRRYHKSGPSVPGGIWLYWDNNTSGEYINNCGYPLWVQDHWSMYSVDYSTKIDEIKSGIEKANTTTENRLFINYVSGEKNGKTFLIEVAEHLNSPIEVYLKDNPSYQTCGALMINFAGGGDPSDGGSRTAAPNLVQTIINMNDLGMEEVTIGSQVWMKKNLNAVMIPGYIFPEVEDCHSWLNSTAGAWRRYSSEDPCLGNFGGRLYNWNAAQQAYPLTACPPGFHVPTDDDWNTLVAHLGGPEVAGGKMKEAGTDHWESPNTGATNESGFTALGRGYWGWGESIGLNRATLFYTYSPANDSVIFRALCDTSRRIFRIADTARTYYGASIRCVRNSK
jgi:uncharacterized protein (TIGR02145 family)